MTRVKTGVKGDFQANIAPKMPEFDPPVPAPNENEFGNTTHTQDPHKCHKTSTQECSHSLKFLYIEQVWFVHECSKCSKLVLSNRYEGS